MFYMPELDVTIAPLFFFFYFQMRSNACSALWM